MPQERVTSKPFSKAFSWMDPIHLGDLLLGGCLGAVTPETSDVAAVRAIAKLSAWTRRDKAEVLALLRRKLKVSETDARSIFRRHLSMRAEDTWARMRGILRPDWRLQVRIEGLEVLQDALARGRGAVIWLTRTGAPLGNFQAFALAGHRLNHVSGEEHGSLTETNFSFRHVAPLYLRGELAALNSRIVIPACTKRQGYFQRARRCLRENQCVSIFGEHAGSASIEATLLGERRRFAIGAPSLAWIEDSTLLISHTRGTGPLQQIVTLEPVPVDRSIPMREFANAATREYVRRLEAWIRAHPASWQGWSFPQHNFPLSSMRMPDSASTGRTA